MIRYGVSSAHKHVRQFHEDTAPVPQVKETTEPMPETPRRKISWENIDAIQPDVKSKGK